MDNMRKSMGNLDCLFVAKNFFKKIELSSYFFELQKEW